MKCAVTNLSRPACVPPIPSNPTAADFCEDVFQNILRRAVMMRKAKNRSSVRVSGLLTSCCARAFIGCDCSIEMLMWKPKVGPES